MICTTYMSNVNVDGIFVDEDFTQANSFAAEPVPFWSNANRIRFNHSCDELCVECLP